MPGFEDLFVEERRIPLSDASAYLVDLFRPTDFPEPVRTPRVEAGLLKMAVVQDVFGDSPQGLAEAERLAMIDPEVQAAMDYAQMRRERDEFKQQNQVLTQQLQQQQQAAQQAQQQAQSTSEQASQLQQLLQNEQMQREQATIQAVQVKDQSLQEQMAAAQKRQELFGLADGLKAQLDQLRAGADQVQQGIDQMQSSAAEAPADMQMRQQQEQQAMAQQQQAEAMTQMPPEQRKETEEAQKAQGKAQEQTAQAEQSQAQGQQQQQQQVQQQEQQAQALQQQGQQEDQQAQPQQPEAAKTAALLRKLAAVKRGKYGPEDRKERQLLPENQMPEETCPVTGKPRRGPGLGPGQGRPLGTGAGMGRGPGGGRGREVEKKAAESAATKDPNVKAKKDLKNPDELPVTEPANLNKVESPEEHEEKEKKADYFRDVGQTATGSALGTAAGLGASLLSKGKIKPSTAMTVGGLGGAVIGATPATMRTVHKLQAPATMSKGAARLRKLAADVDTARALGDDIGVVWDSVDFTPADLARGMKVEQEHNRGSTDVVPEGRADITTAKIALAHLRERGDYYKLLQARVEDAPMPKTAGDAPGLEPRTITAPPISKEDWIRETEAGAPTTGSWIGGVTGGLLGGAAGIPLAKRLIPEGVGREAVSVGKRLGVAGGAVGAGVLGGALLGRHVLTKAFAPARQRMYESTTPEEIQAERDMNLAWDLGRKGQASDAEVEAAEGRYYDLRDRLGAEKADPTAFEGLAPPQKEQMLGRLGMGKTAGGEFYEATDFNKGEGNVAAMECARQQKVTYPNVTAGEGGDAVRKALEYIAKERHRGANVLPSFLDPQQPAIKPEDREQDEKIKAESIVLSKGEPTTVKKLAAVLAERLRRAAR